MQQLNAVKDESRLYSVMSLTNKEMQQRDSAHRNIDTEPPTKDMCHLPKIRRTKALIID